MNSNFCILAIAKFYSRVVLKKISNVALVQYRKVENDYKKLLKVNADIKYINMGTSTVDYCDEWITEPREQVP